MRLTYRGIGYDYEPTLIESAESNGGFYRGHAYSFSYPKHIPLAQRDVQMTYRGVDYRLTRAGKVESIAPIAAPASMTSRLQSRQAKLKATAIAHHQNIQRSLEHRLDVAKEKGDRALIQQLEREMQMM